MQESLSLITPPDDDVVTVESVKTALGITGDGQDEMIEAAVDAVVGTLDPATGGWLGRALRPQTWELRLSQFPSCKIMLPYPVLISLDSIKYDDQSGVEQTLVEGTGYRVFGLGGHSKASVAPIYNGLWPSARCDVESVRIRFTCGYDGEIPGAIKGAINAGVRAMMSATERSLFVSSKKIEGVSETSWFAGETAAQILNDAINNLLSTYRVW